MRKNLAALLYLIYIKNKCAVFCTSKTKVGFCSGEIFNVFSVRYGKSERNC